MCEIDNARPKIENLQTTEKSRGWLGFWRNSDQKNRSDPSCFMKNFRTNDTKENRKIQKIIEKKIQKILKIDIADVINY